MAFRATRSLMAAAKTTAGKSSFAKNWLSDAGTYPIMIIIGAATCLVGYQGQRILLNHPDIQFDKDSRNAYIRDNDRDAESHHEHALRLRSRGGDTQIMSGLNTMMVSGKVKN